MSLIQKLFPQSQESPDRSDETRPPEDTEKLLESLSIIASESFRFRKTLNTVITRLSPEEQQKYAGQFSWYLKRVGRALEDSGYRTLDLEGEPYDPGMAVTPLNIDEFAPEDSLIIEQMIEPIVMQGGTVRRTGTVILGRVEE